VIELVAVAGRIVSTPFLISWNNRRKSASAAVTLIVADVQVMSRKRQFANQSQWYTPPGI